MKNVREPAVAGMFYPSSSVKLREEIQLLLDANKPREKYQNIFGIVSPHAGYVYSGRTAAIAYNTIADKSYKTVIIISPSHKEYFPGVSIYSGDAYKTPLGSVSLNKEMIAGLTSGEKFIFEGMNGHRGEHALEVQLPFLQMVLKDFSIIPIVMGDQRRMFVDGLAQKLADTVDEDTLIIASSDLSHFHTKREAGKIDALIEKRISDFDFRGLQNDLEVKNCEACGGGGIVTLMKAAAFCGKTGSAVLSRTDSGDVTGDDTEVVGYLSAVIFEPI
ncbi:MAG: AmmeMemoRadiSam system protein B [Ignavibacteriae bacterium HGW-Ignavibacteriae-3]|nr:MAG: AmmeMemoRadiSam system protein B [Ignavibacteriae bacterium HGW-Ignavibacteriae-3]